ncbi:Transcriptional regulator [Solimicrobium silvestre]|uniref:Transcriptional regulator n=1 Tax=Solimicrobium silvestre TaxID=2099400 RepID=A0A2S9H2K8_9BURK|nr:Transcriptional regulator [Solimicrobium silvestre]
MIVNHIPFLVDATRGEYGTLIGHVARANSIWKSFSSEIASVIIFQGPQGYITPSWYPSKHRHGKAVPTWNYTVVHAHGIPRAIEDKDWLLQHVTTLSDLYESKRAMPWRVSDAPSEYIDSMLNTIIGIEIPINAVVGQWKMSQNKPLSDKLGIIEGLHEHVDENSQQMVALVKRGNHKI